MSPSLKAPADILAAQGDAIDSRYHPSAAVRRQLNKVFPTHWSFLLGEIALYSFIVLLITGVYLTLFFDPSMAEVTYNGVYQPLRGVQMSKAYESTLDISFEVRGGLFVRQVHHWAALMFAAAIMVHLARVFFTGAFRRPREANWVIGSLLLILAMFEGYFGYSLPDDLLSGIGLRAALSSITLGMPVIGTWLHWALFGGDFPCGGVGYQCNEYGIWVPRMYALHILLIPGIILALIGLHMALVWFQKHTQFPGPGRTETNVVGVRVMPVFAVKSGAFFAIITGVLGLLGGLLTINPVWNLGPYKPSQVSAGSQPDFYMMWTEGMARIMPPWEIYIGNYTIPASVWVALFMGLVFVMLPAWPWIEKKLTGDDAHHNLLQRPRDVPVRTAFGAAAISLYMLLTLCAMNDIIALKFHISLNATTWIGRIGMVVLPAIVYFVAYRWAVGLQRSDREVLEHGIETGIIKRLPQGAYIELHQPLGPVDEHGHPIPLEYQGAPVPKRMNKLGSAGTPGSGSFLSPDPIEEHEALEAAHHAAERKALAALAEYQARISGNGDSSNGHH
ncbi:cytochrome b subunit of the bc complex [Mycolicibacterium phlei]|jgi:ubiquinol-cytochrome c reductase cytochrome b subunit|uniref:Cytochrome bc1 complex cytochrome b subunit n=1 Tax=Mycolicibacterium phlei DSM 43239 = CCUG 21000 TaxID=1226750 RepID=A0A5N5V969_MYCPH|nr:cytochrome bc complex cytochrome b subunit [Mycolicibacterium phlei]VEG10237.1 cytochrome b subunit of the bc complex [Mycobacteroides chelonae]AMO62132.1 Cytochrome b6 [Mycolicibacterium phlei]KAB7757039.1 menaquinol-cytochrome C reductase cytochrome b subunit [Mycolicibacterium phlei DSM 43239 = CCUG 21000]KXW62557.1 menaquinol-cytochrome C reductase cytochrome b subunit [Mycolicibacterium phlei DSM 43070]KXW66071.1 menaquinol-cytochrome C reductase cytochrome b subunit [Mycolicibacterium